MGFKLKTHWETKDHPHMTITYTQDNGQTYSQHFCGDSWCRGGCGFPALVLLAELGHPDGPLALKAHSAMTACGPVWQEFRNKPWIGENVPVPEDVAALPDITKMMWW